MLAAASGGLTIKHREQYLWASDTTAAAKPAMANAAAIIKAKTGVAGRRRAKDLLAAIGTRAETA